MTPKNALIVLPAAMACILIGCSDPRVASKSNFEKAAAAYYKTPSAGQACISLPETDAMLMMFFGANEEDKTAIVVKAGGRNEKKLDSLVKAGLATKETRPTRGSIESYRYKLTEKAAPFQNGAKNALCYANIKLVRVKEYTEPAPLLGQTVSEATLTLELEKKAEWMNDRNIQTLWLGTEANLDAPFERKRIFVLMNNGWAMQ